MTMEKSEIKAYIQEVAKKLGEKEEQPLRQIELLIEHVGVDFVKEMLDETMRIEAKDGMKTEDGKRRRTPGGVFFYISKGKLDAELRQQIFPNFGQREKLKVVEWDERREFVDPLLTDEATGNMRYVTVNLHGRPGTVVVEGDTVITTISHRHKPTPLPRGVPHPPDDPTCYTVYMSRKHWEDVAESIDTYKSDRLIIEGSIFYDKETDTIAVFAMNVTTRRTEKMARKEEQPQKQQTQLTQGKGKAPSKSKAAASSIAIPDGMPADAAAKLRQLHNAADTLRERIKEMEAKGQAGVSMTKKLLRSTEKQIEALEKQYSN